MGTAQTEAQRQEALIAELVAALKRAISEADSWHDDCRNGPCPGLDNERALLARLET